MNGNEAQTILTQRDGPVWVVTINRPQVRNAVDAATALALAQAFHEFEEDQNLSVAILAGAQGTFCAGADLREIADGSRRTIQEDGDGPMGAYVDVVEQAGAGGRRRPCRRRRP